MSMKNKITTVALVTVIAFGSIFSKKMYGQEISAKPIAGTYKNGTEQMIGMGLEASKPLTDKISAGFDLTLAKSGKPDIVESVQIWASFKLSDSSKVFLTPYIYKDRFYSVESFGAGAILSIGNLNIFAEYNEPKTWAGLASYKFNIGNFSIIPKLIALQFNDRIVGILGAELKLTFDAGKGITPFLKIKTMDLLKTGKCSTNAQGGISFQL